MSNSQNNKSKYETAFTGLRIHLFVCCTMYFVPIPSPSALSSRHVWRQAGRWLLPLMTIAMRWDTRASQNNFPFQSENKITEKAKESKTCLVKSKLMSFWLSVLPVLPFFDLDWTNRRQRRGMPVAKCGSCCQPAVAC